MQRRPERPNKLNQNRPSRPSVSKAAQHEEKRQTISFSPTINSLPTGKQYAGTITECQISPDESWIFLKIKLGSRNANFSTVFKYPLAGFSPLIAVLSELDEGSGNVYCEDLVGLDVIFTTSIKEKNGNSYCNIRSIQLKNDEDEDVEGEEGDGEGEDNLDDFMVEED